MSTAEGCELARRHCCSRFYEVSAAEAEKTEPDIGAIFTQLVRQARAYRLQQQQQPAAGGGGGGGGGGLPCGVAACATGRQRKKSVFTINRMLGSLIGRNSMPPELPSSMGTSLPNVTGSFKSVFKKRSV